MSTNIPGRIPHLGKLSVALLEHIVEPIIGEDAKNLLKSPLIEKELTEKLALTLEFTEDRFKKQFADKEIVEGLLSLPFSNLPSLNSALRTFYDRPTGSDFPDFLQGELMSTFLTV